MLPLDESSAWVALTRAPGLDVAAVSALLEILGPDRQLLDASDAERARAGMSAAALEYLSSTQAALSSSERTWLEKPRHHVVPFNHPRYPALLRQSRHCPIALYVTGNVEVLSDAQLAVVGSRNPTAQGRETACEFCEDLAERGLAITSGLAAGIDSAAHEGALLAQGITIAVLGSGVDVIYPRASRPLSARILEQGALVSSFPLGTPPRRQNFPQRNGIIAALSLGTLVVEAACRSGSLITARLALELGRKLFAIPGSIYNPLSRGCHELIRTEAARLTESAHDILSGLDFSAFFSIASGRSTKRSAVPLGAPDGGCHGDPLRASGMDKDHKILLDALGFDPADLDIMVARTGFKPEAVSSMMLILELEGHVQAAPGGRYSRVVRSRR